MNTTARLLIEELDTAKMLLKREQQANREGYATDVVEAAQLRLYNAQNAIFDYVRKLANE